ncbi:c-type cytochrome [Phaeobacter sp. HF9A]|nr:cytochrome c peroxidase [Phaeobacter sp. HF9A]NIZ13522.1 c-type cytochrome [Phaeobacter sp. HF9A]
MTALLIGLCGATLVAAASWQDIQQEYARPAYIDFPEGTTYSPQKAALGKMLFFDARLSGPQNLSCATCHNPSFGWESPTPRAKGARNQALARHTPTLENLAEATHFFWDGRASSLEEQARGPITHPMEMGSSMEEVVARLKQISGYRRYFRIAFPQEGLTQSTVLSALATYQRTLRSGWSPFDDWISGDEDAISETAKRGFDVFTGVGNCNSCHTGWAFTDHQFHNIGLLGEDIGRGAFDPNMRYRFKTPGLRNIALRAPYMHDGSLPSLRDVIEHYRHGGASQEGVSSDLSPLTDMTDNDITDLIAFLDSLTAYEPHVSAPSLPAN